jgi:hypothetical protein
MSSVVYWVQGQAVPPICVTNFDDGRQWRNQSFLCILHVRSKAVLGQTVRETPTTTGWNWKRGMQGCLHNPRQPTFSLLWKVFP